MMDKGQKCKVSGRQGEFTVVKPLLKKENLTGYHLYHAASGMHHFYPLDRVTEIKPKKPRKKKGRK